jgi:putative phosphotransacetylase
MVAQAERTGCQPWCQDCGACRTGGARNTTQNKPAAMPTVADIIAEENSHCHGKGVTGTAEVPLGASNRHMHLRKATFAELFGPGVALEAYRELYQSGEFASTSTVLIVGPKLVPIQNVRILGPFRKYDQVEISWIDAVTLGIRPPVRESGDTMRSAPVTLVGPKVTVNLREGAIIAARHVHMSPSDAISFGVSNGDLVRVRILGPRAATYDNVLVRVAPTFRLQLHLDTDEANAVAVSCGTAAEFLGKTG